MINVAIQFLTLLSGLLVNFIVPLLYGLEAYGVFIQTNILVFVFQKLTDIMNEPLIGQNEPAQVFPMAFVMAMIVWMLFAVVDHFVVALGSPLLLAAMLLSACVALGLYALRRYRMLVFYLAGFLATFFVLIGFKELAHWPLSIVDVLVWTNLVAAIPMMIPLTLAAAWRGIALQLAKTLRIAPANVSATLVFNLFTNLLPYLLSKTLPPVELGLFRVMTSVVQAATSLFPVNTKALFVMFRRHPDSSNAYPTLLGLALFWFAGLAFILFVLAVLEPRLLPFLALAGILPVFYWGVLGERYLLATSHKRALVIVNLAVGLPSIVGALRVENLDQALVLYATSFAVYTACTLMLAKRNTVRIAALAITGITPLMVFLQSQNLAIMLLWQALLVMLSLTIFRVRFSDVRSLGSRL